jgi:Flp pilus assembly protein TadG
MIGSIGSSPRRGAAAVEFAIVFPILLLFVLGLMDFARMIWVQSTLDYAVEAAARCAAINATTCGTAAQIQNYAVSQALGLDIPASAFSVASGACGKQVSANFTFEFILPWMASGSIALTATACYPT